jgi:hypothetical protein
LMVHKILRAFDQNNCEPDVLFAVKTCA